MAGSAINKIRQIVRLKQVMHRWRHSTSHVIPIEIGPTRTRFTIPTRFVNLPIFVSLLNQAREEFGYQTEGVISLPSCDPDVFRVIVDFLEVDEEKYGKMGIEDFSMFAKDYSCNGSGRASCGDAQAKPLLQKA